MEQFFTNILSKWEGIAEELDALFYELKRKQNRTYVEDVQKVAALKMRDALNEEIIPDLKMLHSIYQKQQSGDSRVATLFPQKQQKQQNMQETAR